MYFQQIQEPFKQFIWIKKQIRSASGDTCYLLHRIGQLRIATKVVRQA